MLSIGIVGSIFSNNLGELNKVILEEASHGVDFAISLAGVMALWMGVMSIACLLYTSDAADDSIRV